MAQPEWQYIGRIGDQDPIAYGGGFVYEDKTGVYAPEITWFEPAPDRDWHETGGKTPLAIYRLIIERDSKSEWWYDKLSDVANSNGLTIEDLQKLAHSGETMPRAALYWDLLGYFGPYQFDQEPVTMTEDEAYEKYAEEMKHR